MRKEFAGEFFGTAFMVAAGLVAVALKAAPEPDDPRATEPDTLA